MEETEEELDDFSVWDWHLSYLLITKSGGDLASILRTESAHSFKSI